MHKITKTIQESLVELDKQMGEVGHKTLTGIPTNPEKIIKSHLLQLQIKLVEVEMETLEKRKWLDKYLGKDGLDEYHQGYNHALEDQISSLTQVLNELKNV